MKMKKYLVTTSLFLMVCLLVIFTFGDLFTDSKTAMNDDDISFDSSNDENLVVFEGKTDGFNSLEQLESETPIIVRGIKVGEEKTVVHRSKIDGVVNGGYTISNFKIEKVFKNGNDDNITTNTIIPISETEFYDKKTKKTYTINGYQKMENDKEYLLFLTNKREGTYTPRGVTFGKVPLNTNNLEILKKTSVVNDDHRTLLNTIFEEAREKYGK